MITKIQLSLSGGEPGETIDLSYSKDDTTCYVTLHCRGCDYEGVSWNLFDALCKARLQLEPQGLIPVCYGASENVYPSGMCLVYGQRIACLFVGKKGATVFSGHLCHRPRSHSLDRRRPERLFR